MRACTGVLVLLSACTFSTNGVSDDVVAIDADPTAPDATPIDADPTAPDAACVPGCDGATLVECDGGPPTETPCELGCSTAGTPHCAEMVPSNLDDTADLVDVTSALSFVGDKFTLYTDTGQIQDGSLVDVRAAGGLVGGTWYRQISATLAVLAVDALTVAEDATIVAYGTRALIILSRGAVQLHGYLDFSAGCDLGGAGFTARCGGPGAGDGGSSTGLAGAGCAGGQGGVNGGDETGGAGGGFASMGGNAGTGNGTPMATSIATCAGTTLIPLRGGSGGGAGSINGTSEGGGGGGALQISSLASITIGAPAALARPTFFMVGAGGVGTNTANKGGGGGGSGGALLLEAPTLSIVDAMVLTGGGGGAGGRVIGQDGDWGTEDGTPAPGGAGDAGGNGAGGAGGTPSVAAATGGGTIDGTGGGGGGHGRLRINTASGTFAIPGGALIVAAPTVGAIARD